MKYLFLFLIPCVLSCEPQTFRRENIQGYSPVYATSQAAVAISNETIRATTNPGKIYAYGNYLFQVEQNEGIHIIDNNNPREPKKLSFIRIPSCSELAIRSNFLYTNNLDDLVVIDISNISTPKTVTRVENAFPDLSQSYPPFTNVYFECPDPSKGTIVRWEKKILATPKCRR